MRLPFLAKIPIMVLISFILFIYFYIFIYTLFIVSCVSYYNLSLLCIFLILSYHNMLPHTMLCTACFYWTSCVSHHINVLYHSVVYLISYLLLYHIVTLCIVQFLWLARKNSTFVYFSYIKKKLATLSTHLYI